jgi:hypothetical protein
LGKEGLVSDHADIHSQGMVGWVGGDCWLYYAEDDFGHIWAGPYNTFVPWNSFDWCWNTASTSGKSIGMRIFCVDWDIMDHTKILTL